MAIAKWGLRGGRNKCTASIQSSVARTRIPLTLTLSPKGRGERREARGGIAVTNRSYGEGGRTNMSFCETNPPIFRSKTAFINLRYNELRGKNLSRNGGFVLENEPTGRGVLVGFGCRDNYFAASRRTRFGKRTHRSAFARPLWRIATGVRRVACRRTPLRQTRRGFEGVFYRETGAQQENGSTEMLRQVPQSCGIPSYDGTQHDRWEESEAATGGVASQFGTSGHDEAWPSTGKGLG